MVIMIELSMVLTLSWNLWNPSSALCNRVNAQGIYAFCISSLRNFHLSICPRKNDTATCIRNETQFWTLARHWKSKENARIAHNVDFALRIYLQTLYLHFHSLVRRPWPDQRPWYNFEWRLLTSPVLNQQWEIGRSAPFNKNSINLFIYSSKNRNL